MVIIHFVVVVKSSIIKHDASNICVLARMFTPMILALGQLELTRVYLNEVRWERTGHRVATKIFEDFDALWPLKDRSFPVNAP